MNYSISSASSSGEIITSHKIIQVLNDISKIDEPTDISNICTRWNDIEFLRLAYATAKITPCKYEWRLDYVPCFVPAT